jgi:prolycopene isomerase
VRDGSVPDYDVIVIGSGLAGLVAGALCARLGLRCAVVEAATQPGGYAGGRRSGPYSFDSAVSLSGQGAPGMIFDHVLGLLGVRDHCDFLPVDPAYAVYFPDLRFAAPSGREPFLEAHVSAFPGDRAGIVRFFEICERLQLEAHELPPALSLVDTAAAAERFPTVMNHLLSTVGEATGALIDGQAARAVCTSMWPVTSLPPAQLSLITFGQLLYCTIDGTFTCRGGFQTLIAALAAGLERHGGSLVLGRRVERLSVEDGRVVGVQLAGGESLRASAVVSNADGRTTYESLLGPDLVPPRVARRLARLRPSLSAYILYAATSADLGDRALASECLVYSSYDHDASYQELVAGHPGCLRVSIPTLLDPHLAPPGQHLVVARVPAPYQGPRPWPELRAHYRAQTLSQLDGIFPDFSRRLEFVEDATPSDLAETTGNQAGAAAGWEATPNQIGSRGLGPRSPVPGLYLAGQWTSGFSLLRTLTSGVHAAQMVAADLGAAATLDLISVPMAPSFDRMRRASRPSA